MNLSPTAFRLEGIFSGIAAVTGTTEGQLLIFFKTYYSPLYVNEISFINFVGCTIYFILLL